MKIFNGSAIQFATFSLQNITRLDAGLDEKIYTAFNIYISAYQTRKFGSSQSL